MKGLSNCEYTYTEFFSFCTADLQIQFRFCELKVNIDKRECRVLSCFLQKDGEDGPQFFQGRALYYILNRKSAALCADCLLLDHKSFTVIQFTCFRGENFSDFLLRSCALIGIDEHKAHEPRINGASSSPRGRAAYQGIGFGHFLINENGKLIYKLAGKSE